MKAYACREKTITELKSVIKQTAVEHLPALLKDPPEIKKPAPKTGIKRRYCMKTTGGGYRQASQRAKWQYLNTFVMLLITGSIYILLTG